MHLRSRSRSLVAAVLAGGLVFASGTAVVAGQFVGERFAPVYAMSEPPALGIRTLSVESVDSSETFVVTFSAPFEAPSDGYRVAVSVGDPTAKRTRWSLTVSAGEVVGNVETGDGTVWDPLGPTTVQLDGATGRATIGTEPGSAELATLPPDSAIWAEVELPTPAGSIAAATSYFAYDVLARPAGDTIGVVPTSSWGWIRDAEGVRVDGAVRVPGSPPTYAVVDRTLVISAPDVPPSLLLDQPVTATADFLRVLSGDDSTSDRGGFVSVDRVTGDVQLFTVLDGVATEVPGGGQTVVPSSASGSSVAPAEPPSTRSVTVEFDALADALGLPDDPSAVAVTVDRAFTLGDGSVVTTTGVAETLAALEPAVEPAPEAEVASEPVVVAVDESSDGIPLAAVAVIGGVVLLALAGAGLVLLARRGRRQEQSLVAEGWLDRDHATPALPEEPPRDSAAADESPVDLDPAVEGVPAAESERPEEVWAAPPPPPAEMSPEAPTADGHDGHDDTDDTDDEADDEPESTSSTARATQDRAMADLEAQFSALIERVDRLGSSDREPG